MKIWFDQFLQDAAIPLIVLAFAFVLLEKKSADIRDSRLSDQRRSAKMQIHAVDLVDERSWYERPENPAFLFLTNIQKRGDQLHATK